MKRFIPAAILVAAALTLFAGIADAALRIGSPVDLGWRNESTWNVGAPLTTPSRDTLFKQIKVGATDTTVAFSTVGWPLPDTSPSDSVVIGYLYVGTDSTAAGSFTATSFTITPQFSMNGKYDWFSGAAITFTDVTSGDKFFKFPIYYVGNTTRGLIGTAGWPPPYMRYLIVAIGGVVSPARCWISHLVP